ncbi:P1 family peptidase [Desulfoscipio gibsoniae]|uniref:L-aminopeptidase/D-esterase n=1 Tax=Desulfoscipio gibsoniae DSM 7213 TaxID=767817 RepID=R4KBJ1_9FIRM|nr:P1 family peptidase [Desulfoscipio gibsoniae]AGL00523.1 L-aminopeptidase/D-esterase [Desulfoscipio gibsoniae DSM 7213]
MYRGYITDITCIKVGHAQDFRAMTGCTVIICEQGATTGVDVRGSAPGTRETDLLKPEKLVDKVHAIVLSGGSAFGLDAASGVMAFLEEKGVGFDVGVTKVPIVCSAVLFDLNIGDYRIRPDYQMGYRACINALENQRLQGNIGAGTGATVGKISGPDNAMKSGLGSAGLQIGNLWVGAIVAVNSYGDVYDHKTNELLAGAIDRETGQFLVSFQYMQKNQEENKKAAGFPMSNTTIGVVATNGKLSKAQAHKVAQMAHDGFARSINPIHTMFDGDTIFAMATGEIEADINLIGTLASEVMSMAITNGVKSAKGWGNLLAWQDRQSSL